MLFSPGNLDSVSAPFALENLDRISTSPLYLAIMRQSTWLWKKYIIFYVKADWFSVDVPVFMQRRPGAPQISSSTEFVECVAAFFGLRPSGR